MVERRTRDPKVASSNSRRSGGRISSQELTLCANSYSVSVPPPCYRSGTQKITVILPKVQVASYPNYAYTLDLAKSEWADYTATLA